MVPWSALSETATLQGPAGEMFREHVGPLFGDFVGLGPIACQALWSHLEPLRLLPELKKPMD